MEIPRYDYCAIVLGLSGHGKSALLSVLCNYLKGNTPDNFEDPFPVCGGIHSKTSEVSFYSFQSIYDRKIYLFIDTPGFNDTNGGHQKEMDHLKQIKQTLNKISKINAVIYVKNSTVIKVTESFRKASQLILRILNNDIKELSIAVLTFSEYDPLSDDDDDDIGIIANNLREYTSIIFEKSRIFKINNILHQYDKVKLRNKRNAVIKYWEKFCNEKLNPIIESIKSREIDNTRSHQIYNFEQKILNTINEFEMKIKISKGTITEYVLQNTNNLNYYCNDCSQNCIRDPGIIKRFFLSVKKFFKRRCDKCFHPCSSHQCDYREWIYETRYNDIRQNQRFFEETRYNGIRQNQRFFEETRYNGIRQNQRFFEENRNEQARLFHDLKSNILILKNLEPDYDIYSYLSEINLDKQGKINEYISDIMNDLKYRYRS